jgi:hypothetical protein
MATDATERAPGLWVRRVRPEEPPRPALQRVASTQRAEEERPREHARTLDAAGNGTRMAGGAPGRWAERCRVAPEAAATECAARIEASLERTGGAGAAPVRAMAATAGEVSRSARGVSAPPGGEPAAAARAAGAGRDVAGGIAGGIAGGGVEMKAASRRRPAVRHEDAREEQRARVEGFR